MGEKGHSYRDLKNDFTGYEPLLKRLATCELLMEQIITYEEMRELGYAGHYIVDGQCRLMVSGPGGAEKIGAVLKRGSFLQLYSKSMLSRASQCFYTEPYPTVRMLAYDETAFMNLLRSEPELTLKLLGFYENLSASLLCDLRDALFCDGKKRVCNLLFDMSMARGADVIHISQEEISMYVGLERSNVARCLKQLKQEGIVETGRGKVKIVDREKLGGLVNM